jgi:bifunctional non-homologous end joining protein LigD
VIRMWEELPRAVSKVIEAVRSLGLEGVIAIRRDSLCQPSDRSSDWLRLKLESQREFVIGGFRPDGASIDALLVGYYEGKALRFAGKVRADFVLHVRRQVCETRPV